MWTRRHTPGHLRRETLTEWWTSLPLLVQLVVGWLVGDMLASVFGSPTENLLCLIRFAASLIGL